MVLQGPFSVSRFLPLTSGYPGFGKMGRSGRPAPGRNEGHQGLGKSGFSSSGCLVGGRRACSATTYRVVTVGTSSVKHADRYGGRVLLVDSWCLSHSWLIFAFS